MTVKEKIKQFYNNDETQDTSDDDHIVKLDLDKDIVLATDDNGNELCQFAFEVLDKNVLFKSPKFCKFPGFVRKMSRLLILLARYTENVEIPDNKTEAYNNPTSQKIWQMVSGYAILAHRSVYKLILEIFFKYLEGSIDSIPARKQKKWFRQNARIEDIQKVFASMLAVDELIKKNAKFLLQREFKTSQERNSKIISIKNPEFQQKKSTLTQSSSLEPL